MQKNKVPCYAKSNTAFLQIIVVIFRFLAEQVLRLLAMPLARIEKVSYLCKAGTTRWFLPY